jgi:hypothetical protein
MRLIASVLTVLVLDLACGNGAASPSSPVWPDKWHANMAITGTEESSELAIRVTASGHFVYQHDPATGKVRSSSLLIDSVTKQKTLDICVDGKFYYINLASGSCSYFHLNGVGGPVEPSFLQQFSYGGVHYMLRDGVYFTTDRWTFDAFHAGENHSFEYWHDRSSNVPFRILGPSHMKEPYGHSIIEYTDFTFGHADINLDFYFTIPSNCQEIKMQAKVTSRNLVSYDIAPVKPPVWPAQFRCSLQTNGISTDPNTAVIGESGEFFYDSKKSRVAEIMQDVVYKTRAKLVFPNNGQVYRMSLSEGTCHFGTIPARFGMTGPVRPDWLNNFKFAGYEYHLRENVYFKTAKWVWHDAFPHSNDTEFPGDFVYWHQVDIDAPFRLLGPGPGSPPYGHAFLEFSDFQVGLSDVDLNPIFSVPSDCKKD